MGDEELHPYVRGFGSKVSAWQQKADSYENKQAANPFSGKWKGVSCVKPKQSEGGYGRPPEGSKTELRGKQAGVHISTEIVELCDMIKQIGTRLPNGKSAVTFGTLFEVYTRISNKVVGMLIRARKQGLVDFEGEILFQRRDDDVVITLLIMPDELMADIERKKLELQDHPAGGGPAKK